MATQQPQRDEDVVTFSAFTGLRDNVTPERFSIGDLVEGTNVDIDSSGKLSRRGGYTEVLAGGAHSLWSDRQQTLMMLVQGGVLKRMFGDYSLETVKTLADPLSPMAYERVSGRIYYSNGTDLGIYENGAGRSWGLPVPPLPGAAAIAGNMPEGTYQFAVTYLRADGQESGASLAGVIQLPASGGIRFTMPVSTAPDVAAKVLYLSPANGEVLFEAVAMANAQVSLDYMSDPSLLSVPLQTQFHSPPPAGQLLAFYRGRMFVAVGDTLFMSEPFAYERFDLRRYFQLDGNITMLAVLIDKESTDVGRGSGFFVGTDQSCGVMAGADADQFVYVPKTDYGAIPGALTYLDGSLLGAGGAGARSLPVWLTTAGLCVGMPDLVVNNLTRAKFDIPAAGRGAALFMPGPQRILATANL